MYKPVLNIEQLNVESFTTSEAETSQDDQIGIVDTGCVSDCATGCGFGPNDC
ncbi:hypothetical protein [Longimicrobium sp.]|uniref:hypothetical protein n=1 Tax=Longimicrobium sp. TaxID=2029185 RepID=UPI003B3BC1AA